MRRAGGLVMRQQGGHRRAGQAPADPHRPLYARVLRLRHLRPSWLLCFFYFEGMLGFGVLLALAELVAWWGVLILPAVVAIMVKINDIVAGATAVAPGERRQAAPPHHTAVRATVPVVMTAAESSLAPPTTAESLAAAAAESSPFPIAAESSPAATAAEDPDSPPHRPARLVSRDPVDVAESVRSPRQRFRQSAIRRYD